jgi:hypothetical protein
MSQSLTFLFALGYKPPVHHLGRGSVKSVKTRSTRNDGTLVIKKQDGNEAYGNSRIAYPLDPLALTHDPTFAHIGSLDSQMTVTAGPSHLGAHRVGAGYLCLTKVLPGRARERFPFSW